MNMKFLENFRKLVSVKILFPLNQIFCTFISFICFYGITNQVGIRSDGKTDSRTSNQDFLGLVSKTDSGTPKLREIKQL